MLATTGTDLIARIAGRQDRTDLPEETTGKGTFAEYLDIVPPATPR